MDKPKSSMKEFYGLIKSLEESIYLLDFILKKNQTNEKDIPLDLLVGHLVLLSQETQDIFWDEFASHDVEANGYQMCFKGL